jgi:ADP-ribosylglycohydrolase
MKNTASGTLFGLAYGDALGKPTEFLSYEEITAQYGVDGPRRLTGHPALVTDDTQMALAVGEGILAAEAFTPAALAVAWRDTFVAWASSPDNNRAPGMTCLRAVGELANGRGWIEASQIGSKGCGANMRVAPVALVPGLSDDDLAGAAQLQAGLTHGHPTGLAASELTAYAIKLLRDGLAPKDLVGALRARSAQQRTVYRGDWLGDLRKRWLSEDYIALGWDECAAALDRVSEALAARNYDGDPCLATGAGWVAEEALATALYCYLISPDDPVAVVARGAASSGDSDSISCLAGSFAGAALGMPAWPTSWREQIEYQDRLTRLADAWD